MILVTGGTGLTGTHLLLQLLGQGENVRSIYRSPDALHKSRSVFELYGKSDLFDKVDWVLGDICNIPTLEHAFPGVNYVYHCAALISFDPADEEKLRKTNIEGTANIVNFCLAYGIKKLCHVSSIAALGDLKEFETTITEESEWNPEKPHNDYAISKYGAEMEIWRGQQEGLNSVIVNPGIILGPIPKEKKWRTGSSELFTLVANGLQFYTKGNTGFVDVIDVVKTMILLMKSDITGERFTVVSQTLTFESILTKIANALRVRKPSVYAKPWMTSIAWKLDWLFSTVFRQKRKITKDDARALHSVSLYSNEKIKTALGYQFQNIETSITNIAALQKHKAT